MNQRQVDRFRESRERRDRAIAKLKDLLLKEVWETSSQIHDRPSRVKLPPPIESLEPPPSRRGLSPAAKQAITVAAMAIGTAIVSALSGMGATKPHEPPPKPPTTQPGP